MVESGTVGAGRSSEVDVTIRGRIFALTYDRLMAKTEDAGLAAQPAVVRVADAQYDGREQRRGQRAEQHPDLDVVVDRAARAEGELADEQRDGEADAPQERQPEHGREEREHRHRDPGRQRPEAVLEVLGQARAGAFGATDHGHGEAEQHPGDGGVGPQQRQRRCGDQQQPAGGLGAQLVADAARLRPRATAEQAEAGRQGVHPGVLQRDRRTCRRPRLPGTPRNRL